MDGTTMPSAAIPVYIHGSLIFFMVLKTILTIGVLVN
jgi:hypothetical protein